MGRATYLPSSSEEGPGVVAMRSIARAAKNGNVQHHPNPSSEEEGLER